MPQVEILNLTKTYSTGGNANMRAIDNVSLKINKGEFLSIVGRSGSGKTTLLSIIGGVLMPTSGKVIFEGTDIYSLNGDRLSEYRAKKVGFIFQFASLLPVLTAKENLLLPGLFNPEKGKGNEKKAVEYLQLVGLGAISNHYPSQLSGGQQRRVAIARALMNDPEMILADEPTGDLDEETEVEIVELFHRINDEQGVTFVMVTHSSDIARRCKKQYRMSRGVLEEEGK